MPERTDAGVQGLEEKKVVLDRPSLPLDVGKVLVVSSGSRINSTPARIEWAFVRIPPSLHNPPLLNQLSTS